ncbi:hypothetical protein [Thalassotalea sp. PS06]|uniref:hypothetical protein n=1 Tax=Thalassotalea sp. PS06 TaxID=2594005 RepID=UPI0011659045|nr:hypothetical protein [Thalassotalea sp. PS06]QDP00235.1 hypothetical protein FNC98_02030 [Thalassotalea sp. PS06]
MQYKLSVRKVSESDLNVNRPFLPEEENFEMHLSAFIQDIELLEFVTKVQKSGDKLFITLDQEANFEQLHAEAKRLLNNSYFDKLIADKGFSEVV